jgi:hypothetical protein
VSILSRSRKQPRDGEQSAPERPPARRTRLDEDGDEIRKRFIQAIEVGATIPAACRYAGIATSTYYRYIEMAQLYPDSLEAEFVEAVEAAMGRTQVRWLAEIEQQGKTDWKALAWKLERRFPEEYGRRTHTEVTGKGSGPLRVETESTIAVELGDVLGKLPPETLTAIVAALDEAEADADSIVPDPDDNEVS